ncbi:hypothetical protein MMC28_011161 [Mycoblastus sanguinarius]|nr:hypothetical protein [Mycoblastus sanguinarius]
MKWPEDSSGLSDGTTASAITNVGYGFLEFDQLLEAKVIFKKALRMWEAMDNSPAGKFKTLNQLTLLAETQKKWAEAESYITPVLEWKRKSTQNDIQIVLPTWTLGFYQLMQGKWHEAEETIGRELAWEREHHDPDDVRTLLCCFWYGECQRLLERHEVAAQYYAIVVAKKEILARHSNLYDDALERLDRCTLRAVDFLFD